MLPPLSPYWNTLSQQEMLMYFGFFGGAMSLYVLLLVSKPGITWSWPLVVLSLLSSIVLGWGLVLFERGIGWSLPIVLALIAVQAAIHWRMARECWGALQSPWTVSWRTVGTLVFASLSTTVLATYVSFEHERLWVSYSLIQGVMPLILFKVGLWWMMDTLRDDSTNRFLSRMGQTTKKESSNAARIYFLSWWNGAVRRKDLTPEEWLERTSRFPQFMDSLWWQKQGTKHWPDAMEWHIKVGTHGMLWFLRQRMETPPEELDDYSDANGIWSFAANS